MKKDPDLMAAEFYYWQLAGGVEVDFLINHIECAVECKSSSRITGDHLKGLRQLTVDHPEVKKRVLVCMEEKDRKTEDGIFILGYGSFIAKLWEGFFF
jgi:predicted AAA+ superfamily ATPase